MAGFILDFYCAAARLGIESDGAHHLGADAAKQDAERSRILAEQSGVRILRVRNEDVLRDAARVMAVIQPALSERLGGGPSDQEHEWK
jgi:very-short-patch-repair endonuclease